MNKNILIINGHPDRDSFCNELSLSYKNGVKRSGSDCILLNLINLNFDPISKGYRKPIPLEPDLKDAQKKIKEAQLIVFVYPNWWGTYPALLKGFIERTFLPNFAFKYKENSFFWDKKLKGKSAQLIVTMDTPIWYYDFFLGKPGHRSMKKSILNFTGISPVRITTLSPIKTSSKQKRERWLCKIEKMGYNQAIRMKNNKN